MTCSASLGQSRGFAVVLWWHARAGSATPPSRDDTKGQLAGLSGRADSFGRLARVLSQRTASVVRTHSRALVILGMTIVVVTAGARPGAAQQKRGALFAVAGGYFGTDLYVGLNVRNKVHLGDSWTYGGRLVMMPQERYGVELSYMHAQSSVTTSSDTVSFGQGTDRGNIGVDQIDISGL